MLKKSLAVIGIILFGILGYLIIKTRPKELTLTIIPNAYSLVSFNESNSTLSVPLYVNQKEAYITDINCLREAFIADNSEDNLYPLKKVSINLIDEVRIKDEKYYQFAFNFTSDYPEESFYLDQAYLIMEYPVCKAKLFLGSFSAYHLEDQDYEFLRINYLKGIVNPIQENKILVGAVIGFKNETNKDLIITNITPLNHNMVVNHIEEFTKDFTSQTDINELSSTYYDFYNCLPASIYQEVNGEQKILCTFGYQSPYEINTLGFSIDYLLDGKPYRMNFVPFTFYENYEKYVNIVDLYFYHFPND